MSSERQIACHGLRRTVRVVGGGDGASVVVCEPDHDFVHVGATCGVGGEEIIRNVGNYGARTGLRPFPGRL